MVRNAMLTSFILPAILIALTTVGCTKDAAVPNAQNDLSKASAPNSDKDAEIKSNLARLSDEDRREAEAQKFCVIEQNNRLGEMGAPVKILVEGQPVFLCCGDCKEEAFKDPKATLAKVAELKRANSSSK